jgi:hypothetical protein
MTRKIIPDGDLSGQWHSCYWFPSNTHPGSEDTSEYEVQAERTGNQLVLQSVPNPSGAYIFIRLLLDGIYAAGSWTENTAPHGEFKGMIYSGVMQLLISDDQQTMAGKWVGVGQDLDRQTPDVYEGRWEFRRRTPT